MQTNFTAEQLRDPNLKEADRILRKCVHCGFCTATCSTYVLDGDERDSGHGDSSIRPPHKPPSNFNATARRDGRRTRGGTRPSRRRMVILFGYLLSTTAR